MNDHPNHLSSLLTPRIIVWLIVAVCLFGDGHLFASIANAAEVQQLEDETVTEDEFWALVNDSRRLMRQAPVRDSDLFDLQVRWRWISAIRFDDGHVQEINTQYIVDQIAAADADFEALADMFDALGTAESTWPETAWTQADAAEAQAVLDGMLASPELQPPDLTWLQEVGEQILDFLERMAAWLTERLPESAVNADGESLRSIGLVIGVIAGLVLLAIIGLVIRTVYSDLVRHAEYDDFLNEGGVPITAEKALDQAHAFAQTGDYRTGVRYLYLSTLLSLEEKGLLRYDRSLTNREYLRSVAHRPELASTLRDVVDVFDRVWYGFQPIDAATYQHYARQVSDLNEVK